MAEFFYHTPSERSLKCFYCAERVKWNALTVYIKGVKKVLCRDCAEKAVEIIKGV
tara:strand:+ start:682 stop:846 length:165 start_codon:yes stop_codon:yes gene_type:complete